MVYALSGLPAATPILGFSFQPRSQLADNLSSVFAALQPRQ